MDLSETLDAACDAALRAPPAWRRASPGEQLRALRLDRGMSQRHLAESSGIAQANISRMERGADATWGSWRKAFFGLGCEVVLLPLPCDEGAEGRIEDEEWRRRDREEAGRAARWG